MASKQLSMEAFFAPPARRGRPRRKRNHSGSGRPAGKRQQTEQERRAAAAKKLEATAEANARLESRKVKETRASLSDDATLEALGEVVREWDSMPTAERQVIGIGKWVGAKAKQVSLRRSAATPRPANPRATP